MIQEGCYEVLPFYAVERGNLGAFLFSGRAHSYSRFPPLRSPAPNGRGYIAGIVMGSVPRQWPGLLTAWA